MEDVASGPYPVLQDDLDRLPGLPLAQHADAYQRLHERLQDALAAVDDA